MRILIAFAFTLLAGMTSVAQLPPPPAQTTNVVPLSSCEQLGKDIFFDLTLSNPAGYSCATCHVPASGFTGPSPAFNTAAGPVPGVVPGRSGRRKPQAISYSTFSPAGPIFTRSEGGTYLGGQFWDGRAPDSAAQARMPFLDQNEMANTPVGPYPPHAGGYSPQVAEKLKTASYAPLFQEVFGANVFNAYSDEQIYALMTAAIAKYEASAEINQFSSKFDASTNGTPPMNLYQFTASEQNGLRLFFGKAQCSQCHSSARLDVVAHATQGKETFTMYCYANIGVPANPRNPFYAQTNCDTDPGGCNSLGTNYIDFGLGANPNPAPDGTKFFKSVPGDIWHLDGLFKTPSLRNVDQRPYPGFVKSYMHNGVFKSLEAVVHFYNKRNIATNAAGKEASFVLSAGAPLGYTAIFPRPEYPFTAQNLYGLTPYEAMTEDRGVSYNGQVGNLQLTAREETDLVNFLKTLTDGYMPPHPAAALPAQAASDGQVVQLDGPFDQFYIMQNSTNWTDWTPASTNLLTSPSIAITNAVTPGAAWQFWRAEAVPSF